MIKQSLVIATTFVLVLLLQACSNTAENAALLASELQITASPSTSAAVGGTIYLTATSTDGTSSPTFTFSLLSTTAGVTLTPSGSTSATVTSSVEATVTVEVTEYSTGSSTVTNTNETTLYFGTTAGTTGAGTLVASNGSIEVYASPSSTAALGGSITLSATSTLGATSFTFTQAYAQSGVTVTPIGTTEATVTSSLATTVSITVTSYGSTTTAATTVPVTLTFGTSYGIGTSTGQVTITPSTTVGTLGVPVTLTAYTSGLTSPIYTFQQLATSTEMPAITLTQLGNGEVEVMSSYAGTVTIEVTATSAYTGATVETGEITLTFGSSTTYPIGTTGTTELICNLDFAPGVYYVDSSITFWIGPNQYALEATDGEPLVITQFNPGEQWDITAPSEYTAPITGYYDYVGPKTISMYAYSAVTGMPCNGGAPLTASLYINQY